MSNRGLRGREVFDYGHGNTQPSAIRSRGRRGRNQHRRRRIRPPWNEADHQQNPNFINNNYYRNNSSDRWRREQAEEITLHENSNNNINSRSDHSLRNSSPVRNESSTSYFEQNDPRLRPKTDWRPTAQKPPEKIQPVVFNKEQRSNWNNNSSSFSSKQVRESPRSSDLSNANDPRLTVLNANHSRSQSGNYPSPERFGSSTLEPSAAAVIKGSNPLNTKSQSERTLGFTVPVPQDPLPSVLGFEEEEEESRSPLVIEVDPTSSENSDTSDCDERVPASTISSNFAEIGGPTSKKLFKSTLNADTTIKSQSVCQKRKLDDQLSVSSSNTLSKTSEVSNQCSINSSTKKQRLNEPVVSNSKEVSPCGANSEKQHAVPSDGNVEKTQTQAFDVITRVINIGGAEKDMLGDILKKKFRLWQESVAGKPSEAVSVTTSEADSVSLHDDNNTTSTQIAETEVAGETMDSAARISENIENSKNASKESKTNVAGDDSVVEIVSNTQGFMDKDRESLSSVSIASLPLSLRSEGELSSSISMDELSISSSDESSSLTTNNKLQEKDNISVNGDFEEKTLKRASDFPPPEEECSPMKCTELITTKETALSTNKNNSIEINGMMPISSRIESNKERKSDDDNNAVSVLSSFGDRLDASRQSEQNDLVIVDEESFLSPLPISKNLPAETSKNQTKRGSLDMPHINLADDEETAETMHSGIVSENAENSKNSPQKESNTSLSGLDTEIVCNVPSFTDKDKESLSSVSIASLPPSLRSEGELSSSSSVDQLSSISSSSVVGSVSCSSSLTTELEVTKNTTVLNEDFEEKSLKRVSDSPTLQEVRSPMRCTELIDTEIVIQPIAENISVEIFEEKPASPQMESTTVHMERMSELDNDNNTVSVLSSGERLDASKLAGRNDLVDVDMESFLSPISKNLPVVTSSKNQTKRVSLDMPHLNLTEADFPVLSIPESETISDCDVSPTPVDSIDSLSSSLVLIPNEESSTVQQMDSTMSFSDIQNSDEPKEPSDSATTSCASLEVVSFNDLTSTVVSVINTNTSEEVPQLTEEDDESEPILRIRGDLFIDDINDRTKEILAEAKLKSQRLATAMRATADKLEQTFFPTDFTSKQVIAFREIRNTVLKTFYVFDSIDAKIRADEAYNYDIPTSYRMDLHKQIAVEELAEYFLRLLNVTFYLRKPEFDNWKNNLIILHYRMSRILKHYAVSIHSSQTEGNFMNIIKCIESKIKKCNIPSKEIIDQIDYLKSFSDPIDEPSVIIEHTHVGIKGFGGLIESIALKVKQQQQQQQQQNLQIQETQQQEEQQQTQQLVAIPQHNQQQLEVAANQAATTVGQHNQQPATGQQEFQQIVAPLRQPQRVRRHQNQQQTTIQQQYQRVQQSTAVAHQTNPGFLGQPSTLATDSIQQQSIEIDDIEFVAEYPSPGPVASNSSSFVSPPNVNFQTVQTNNGTPYRYSVGRTSPISPAVVQRNTPQNFYQQQQQQHAGSPPNYIPPVLNTSVVENHINRRDSSDSFTSVQSFSPSPNGNYYPQTGTSSRVQLTQSQNSARSRPVSSVPVNLQQQYYVPTSSGIHTTTSNSLSINQATPFTLTPEIRNRLVNRLQTTHTTPNRTAAGYHIHRPPVQQQQHPSVMQYTCSIQQGSQGPRATMNRQMISSTQPVQQYQRAQMVNNPIQNQNLAVANNNMVLQPTSQSNQYSTVHHAPYQTTSDQLQYNTYGGTDNVNVSQLQHQLQNEGIRIRRAQNNNNNNQIHQTSSEAQIHQNTQNPLLTNQLNQIAPTNVHYISSPMRLIHQTAGSGLASNQLYHHQQPGSNSNSHQQTASSLFIQQQQVNHRNGNAMRQQNTLHQQHHQPHIQNLQLQSSSAYNQEPPLLVDPLLLD